MSREKISVSGPPLHTHCDIEIKSRMSHFKCFHPSHFSNYFSESSAWSRSVISLRLSSNPSQKIDSFDDILGNRLWPTLAFPTTLMTSEYFLWIKPALDVDVSLCWLWVVRSFIALKTLQMMSFPPPETIPIFLLQLKTWLFFNK